MNPYLAFDSIADGHAKGRYESLSIGKCAYNYKLALEAGLSKILSKMGISVISAYRGGCNFEALGLSRTLVEEFFPGMTSRISGIGLAGLEKKTAEIHLKAWSGAAPPLSVGGFYRHRRQGERHILEAGLVHDLQQAVRNDDAAAYARYSSALDDQPPSQICDLLRVRSID